MTTLLQGIERSPESAPQLLALVYDELRRLAAAKLARDPAAHTLQPTDLVHEAWLRLGGEEQPTWQGRRHFFGAAAEAMRQILIERARRRQAARHGGGQRRVGAEAIDESPAAMDDDRVVAISEALTQFAAVDPRKAELVKLRYFVGLTIEETAAALEISVPTAKRWWVFARAWLGRELKAG